MYICICSVVFCLVFICKLEMILGCLLLVEILFFIDFILIFVLGNRNLLCCFRMRNYRLSVSFVKIDNKMMNNF